MKGTRTLYLLRHAKSSWDHEDLDDFDRPLSDRGRRACAAIAAHVAAEGISPDIVLCSPSQRTRETLAGIEASIGAPPAELLDELYGAGAKTISAVVNASPDRAGSVMVIGHNPGIQAAVLQLAGGGADLDRVRSKYPTAALATIGFEVGSWRDVLPGSGNLAAFVRPRDLRGRPDPGHG